MFKVLLARFNKLIEGEPKPETIKEGLLKIKDDAVNNAELNIRQRYAITARITNYLNGSYGNTKTDEHLGHSKPSKPK